MKEVILLENGWEFRGESGEWMPVPRMPMQIQDILLEYKMIDTPWLPGNTEKCRWIWEREWTYRTVFNMPQTEKTTYLLLKGLDTYAIIYINGKPIASACDAFLPLRVNLSSIIQNGENTLEINFRSPFRELERQYPEKSFGQIGNYAHFIRKKYTDFVDHIGPVPYFAQVGVFDDIQIELVDQVEISDINLRPLLHDDYTRGELLAQIGCTPSNDNTVQIILKAPDGALVGMVEGMPGEVMSIAVDAPLLWWPCGYGAQPLYSVDIVLLKKGVERDHSTRQIGFRKITMDVPFHFQVNGKPVMLRGGNLNPFDQMSKIHNSLRMNEILDRAGNANFNVMRLWSLCDAFFDELYEEADRRGIFLWQDMFYISNETSELLEAARMEAETLVKRVKHHPCVLLWCGGNERMMFHSLNKQKTDMEGFIYLNDIFREVCARLDPDRYYHVESPSGGRFPNDPRIGNTHGYTNMWYVPGYDNLNFATEDTRLGPPGLKSLERFLGPENIWPKGYSGRVTPQSMDPWPDTWSEYTIKTAFWQKKLGPVERFYDPVDARTLVYNISSAQGQYYRETIERCRRGIVASNGIVDRQCGGYIMWKFNASWPQIYSAILDYFMEPYIAYYMVKRAYEPLLLSFDIGNHIVLWVVNDSSTPITGVVKVIQFDIIKNSIVDEFREIVQINPGQSKIVADLDQWGMIWRECVLFACIEDNNASVLSRTNDFLELERKLNYPPARLFLSMENGDLLISSDLFARSVELSAGDDGKEFGWLFEDNYFDLLPGETKRVKILKKSGGAVINARAFYSPHTTVIPIN